MCYSHIALDPPRDDRAAKGVDADGFIQVRAQVGSEVEPSPLQITPGEPLPQSLEHRLGDDRDHISVGLEEPLPE